jgi:hypothetical protein
MGRQDWVDLVRMAEYVVRDLGRDDIGFVLLGDGECLEEMRELVRDLKLEPWVSMPGWLSEADVFGCLAAADLGIDMSLQSEVSLPARVAGSALISVARETSEYWAHALWTNRWPSNELHVLLYGLEGMLILAGKRDGHGLRLVERSFARLMLPPGYPSGSCKPIVTPEYALAQVNCENNSDPGGPVSATYTLVRDKAALDAALKDIVTSSTRVNCPGNIQSPGPWRRNAAPQTISGVALLRLPGRPTNGRMDR